MLQTARTGSAKEAAMKAQLLWMFCVFFFLILIPPALLIMMVLVVTPVPVGYGILFWLPISLFCTALLGTWYHRQSRRSSNGQHPLL